MEPNNEGASNTITSVGANLHGNDNDELVSNWMNHAMIGVAAASYSTIVWLQLTAAGIALHTSQISSTPKERTNTRRAVIKNIIQSNRRCLDLLRLSTDAFKALVNDLKNKSLVKDFSRGSIEEQLVTFLILLGHNLNNRVISFFLCRSGETISRYFHNILRSVITLEDEYVKPANGEQVQPSILNNRRFYPYFKDCLGAIDGTHVRVKVSQIEAPRYRGRKEWPTQNVLAACTFDLKFTYILAGWEGSAADSRILQNALTRDEPLVIPDGKYYLGDAGFGITSHILTPYGRTRYHLKEYTHRAPETPQELFNHRHSSLRNAIERAFGVLKKRFPIIASGTECQYSCATMTDIILACFVLHNFMLTLNEDVDALPVSPEVQVHESVEHAEIDTEMHNNHNLSMEYTLGQRLRDQIASEMWAAYNACREDSNLHTTTFDSI